MKKTLIISSLAALVVLIAGFSSKFFQKEQFTKDTKLSTALIALGDKEPLHALEFDAELAKKGEEMFKEGRTTRPDGKKTNIISKHFQCTACHNTVIEDPDLTTSNPEARLEYAKKNDLPFLQGTTVYGVVNRETWYNEDYYRKYGSLVEAARDTLVNAIQLCCTYCAQGRALDEWEMETMLQYFWSIEYKLSDLDLSDKELTTINKASSTQEKTKALEIIKSKYLTYSPATFIDPPPNKEEGYQLTGYTPNPDHGKAIYERSCQHCHNPDGYTHYILDDTKMTFNMLENNLTDNGHYGVYWVLRYGTKPLYGYKPYMPHYTAERLSKEQTEDLVAYIKSRTEGS